MQIGHVERFNGALRACEPYLEEPLFVESHRLAPFAPRGTDVPVVLDLMIHDLDLVLSLVRRPVRSVAAAGVPVLTPSPDIANARLEFEGGAVANLTASRVSVERKRKIRFFQRSGYISLDLAAGVGEFLRLRPGVELVPGKPLHAAGIEELVERIELHSDGEEPLRCELESFVAAVQGRGAVAVTGDEEPERAGGRAGNLGADRGSCRSSRSVVSGESRAGPAYGRRRCGSWWRPSRWWCWRSGISAGSHERGRADHPAVGG